MNELIPVQCNTESLLTTLHRVWRQVDPGDRLRFLTEMLTPAERRAMCLGLDEEDEGSKNIIGNSLPKKDHPMLRCANVYIFDIETAHSADACLYCAGSPECHAGETGKTHDYEPIGWNNPLALGLSIGCAFSYRRMSVEWFDTSALEQIITRWVAEQPLMVGFNSLRFDGPLLQAILRNRDESLYQLCDAFQDLMGRGYDILDAVWSADPVRKFERGLNSLGAISVANGYGEKAMDGAMAPRLWRAGRIAEVLNYCAGDVGKTRRLFEQIVSTGNLLRGDGQPITLPRPAIPQEISG